MLLMVRPDIKGEKATINDTIKEMKNIFDNPSPVITWRNGRTGAQAIQKKHYMKKCERTILVMIPSDNNELKSVNTIGFIAAALIVQEGINGSDLV
jgi:hypothetical protein